MFAELDTASGLPAPATAVSGAHAVPPQDDPHSLPGDAEDRGQLVHRLAASVLLDHVCDLRLRQPQKLPAPRPLRLFPPRQLPGLMLLVAPEQGL
jgi:hypothetical protein